MISSYVRYIMIGLVMSGSTQAMGDHNHLSLPNTNNDSGSERRLTPYASFKYVPKPTTSENSINAKFIQLVKLNTWMHTVVSLIEPFSQDFDESIYEVGVLNTTAETLKRFQEALKEDYPLLADLVIFSERSQSNVSMLKKIQEKHTAVQEMVLNILSDQLSMKNNEDIHVQNVSLFSDYHAAFLGLREGVKADYDDMKRKVIWANGMTDQEILDDKNTSSSNISKSSTRSPVRNPISWLAWIFPCFK